MAGLDQRNVYKFDGSHPARWLAQMEKYFRLNYIMDDVTQLSVGIMYLDHEIWQWWQCDKKMPSKGNYLADVRKIYL